MPRWLASHSVKVLFINSRPDAMKQWGGDTTQMVETGRHLAACGVQVEMPPDGRLTEGGYDLIHVFNIQTLAAQSDNYRGLLHTRKPIALSTVYWDLNLALNQEDNLIYGEGTYFRLLAGFLPKTAVRLHRLRRAPAEKRLKRGQEAMLRKAVVILPNSVAELEMLVAAFAYPQLRGKAVIVPNGVEVDDRSDAGKSDDGPQIPESCVLMVAAYNAFKGQARLIQALMNDREIPIVCVGPGLNHTRYGQHCRALAERRGNTHLFDAIPHVRMPRVYRRARVHALPSLRESPGLASLEAAIWGARCVVSCHAPISEYFGTDAWVCDPLDPADLRSAVLRAWKAPDNGNLRDRILKEFTWQKAAEQTFRAYEYALGTSVPSVP